jgi:Protein of unknown function (DUF3237)
MQLRHFATLSVICSADFYDVGKVPFGHRRVIPILGGTFKGDNFNGDVMPGGADWNLVHPDGTVNFWARYTLRTDDGVFIGILNEGYQLGGGPDDIERMIAGEKIDLSNVLTRGKPQLEAPAGKYAYLNNRFFVSDLLPTSPTTLDILITEVC